MGRKKSEKHLRGFHETADSYGGVPMWLLVCTLAGQDEKNQILAHKKELHSRQK